MPGNFEKFHDAADEQDILFYDGDGISPEDAGRRDAQAAMSEAALILKVAADKLRGTARLE